MNLHNNDEITNNFIIIVQFGKNTKLLYILIKYEGNNKNDDDE